MFSSIWQDLNNISLNKRTMTNLAGSSMASASPEYKSHFNHSDSNNYSNSSNYNSNSSPSLVPNGEGIYSREVLMNKTVDELPEGMDPTKKEVTALLV